MALLSSIYHRQLAGFSVKKFVPTDFAMMSFCCHMKDEHTILGRDYTTEVPPFASRFSDTELNGHLLACADEDGVVRLLDTRRQGPEALIKEWTAHSNAIFDIAWMETQPKLVTASGDQTAALWDVHGERLLTEFKGHKGSLKSVNFRKDDIFVFATGARDGNIMIWDIRCNRRDGYFKPTDIIHNAHAIETSNTPKRPQKRASRTKSSVGQHQSVTAVIFQDQNRIISAGAMDGNIKVWDLRKTYSTLKCQPMHCHIFPYPGNEPRRHGFSSLVLDSNNTRLYASCTNDKIYQYDCTVFKEQPLAAFTGHQNSTFYVKCAISPDDNYILSGSSDNHGYIWNVNKPQAPPVAVVGHVGEVTSVAWSPVNIEKIVTCSDDNNIRIWRMTRNEERDRTHYVGWSELAVSRKNSSLKTTHATTPSKTSQEPSSPCTIPATISTTAGPSASPLHIVRTPLPRTPGANRYLYNPPSPTVIPPSTPPTPSLQRKQQLLSSWLKLTPSKENTSTHSQGTRIDNRSSEGNDTAQNSVQAWSSNGDSNEGAHDNDNATASNEDEGPNDKVKTITNNALKAKNVIVTKNKKSLFSDKMRENNNDISNTRQNDNTSSGKRSSKSLQCDQHENIPSPARKRQCLDFSASKDNTLPETYSASPAVDTLTDEKENIGPSRRENIEQQHKENNSVNWFINWKNYIQNSKGNVKRHKGPVSGEMGENVPCKENTEVSQLVDPKQSILKYFKPVLSPAKESTS